MPSIGQTWVLSSIGAVVEMGVLSTLKRLSMVSKKTSACKSSQLPWISQFNIYLSGIKAYASFYPETGMVYRPRPIFYGQAHAWIYGVNYRYIAKAPSLFTAALNDKR
jgi:hypothetical protein